MRSLRRVGLLLFYHLLESSWCSHLPQHGTSLCFHVFTMLDNDCIQTTEVKIILSLASTTFIYLHCLLRCLHVAKMAMNQTFTSMLYSLHVLAMIDYY